EDLTLADLEVHAIEGLESRGIGLGEAGNGDDGRCGHPGKLTRRARPLLSSGWESPGRPKKTPRSSRGGRELPEDQLQEISVSSSAPRHCTSHPCSPPCRGRGRRGPTGRPSCPCS